MAIQSRGWMKVLAVFLIISIGTLFVWLNFLFTPVITDDSGMKYVVRPGASINSVITELTNLHVIQNPTLFKLLIRLRGNSQDLKAGEYFFPKGTTSLRIMRQIMNGEGVYYHTFTIISGWNFKQIQEALLNAPDLQHKTQNLNDAEIMRQIGATNEKPEGLFFPDTYYYSTNSTDLFVLKRAYQTMQNKLDTAWQHRDSDLPYQSAYDALIVASLIEKEAHINSERPTIAGVILNRLKKNMLLQIDPTVIYGMGSQYNGTIRKSDLAKNTPYNTYLNKGLPPTPIAMPSIESINAAIHPEKHDFYYFVVTNTGDSRHRFSATLKEHDVAVTEARAIRPEYFNTELIRIYLFKAFSNNINYQI
jgi:UPF0755 protein